MFSGYSLWTLRFWMHFSRTLFVFCWQTLIGSTWSQILHTFEFSRKKAPETWENMIFVFVNMTLDSFAEQKDCAFLQNHFHGDVLVKFHFKATTICPDTPGWKQNYLVIFSYLNPRYCYSLCVCLCFLDILYGLYGFECILACKFLFSARKR